MEPFDNSDLNNKGFWYPLDNAAKIFPAITNKKVTSVFRISATLKQPINIKLLFKAVRTIEVRFPYYKVKLKKGFFWYYFESANFRTSVEVDRHPPCRKFPNEGPLFRVLALNNRISVEFSHMLTDGSGAIMYFRTLLASYFELSGVELPSAFQHLDTSETPNPEEFEDAYNRYFKEDVPASGKRSKAFHLPFALNSSSGFDVLNAMLSAEEIKTKASEKGVNITVYLTAVYLYVLQEIFENLNPGTQNHSSKKLSIQVPINLRNIYPTATMRNFSLFVMPEIDLSLGHYSFDEIIKTVYHQMQLETDAKLINKILARNVGSERKILIRSIPLFVKSFVLRMNYYALGSSQYSGVLTNLGGSTFPPELNGLIDYISIVPPPPNKLIKVSCGIIGYNDKLILSFGNISKTKEFEKRFIHFLIKQEIGVKLITYYK